MQDDSTIFYIIIIVHTSLGKDSRGNNKKILSHATRWSLSKRTLLRSYGVFSAPLSRLSPGWVLEQTYFVLGFLLKRVPVQTTTSVRPYTFYVVSAFLLCLSTQFCANVKFDFYSNTIGPRETHHSRFLCVIAYTFYRSKMHNCSSKLAFVLWLKYIFTFILLVVSIFIRCLMQCWASVSFFFNLLICNYNHQ